MQWTKTVPDRDWICRLCRQRLDHIVHLVGIAGYAVCHALLADFSPPVINL